MNAKPVLIPKASLPDCAVGETLKIVSEDGDNFVVEPEYEENNEGDTPAPDAGKTPMKGNHAPAVAIVISGGGRGGKNKKA